METFIDSVVKLVREKYHDNLQNLCVVFPTRRACLIFRNRFAAILERPVWSPGILGIGDFVSRHSTNPVSEEIPLLLTLFEVYKKHWPEQDFAKFYAWGQMLINDFDEIDKQLHDPSRIFANISDLKKIDATFLPEPASLKWIQEFIASMNEEKLTHIQQQFSNTWNRLRQIYTDYNELLDQKAMAYEGKAYRDIIEKLRNGNFLSPWSHFVFAGFYGFSRIEEDLIRRLTAKHPVTVLWDSDSYYINKKNHEAGYYFRKSPLFSTLLEQPVSHFEKSLKKIEITGIPLLAGQAKYTGELLNRLISEGKLDCNTTAVILPDENMLFPMLYSLPDSIKTINVTMGYPLQQSQYMELIKVLQDLHKHSKNNAPHFHTFHHRYVSRLFNHPLFKNKIIREKVVDSMEFNIYRDAKGIEKYYGFPNAQKVFFEIKNSGEVIYYLEKILLFLREDIIARSGTSVHFEDKVIEYIISELKILSDHIKDHLNDISIDTAWQMAAACISGLKVPFSGEPVQGLQIMGFLETRALDFKTVIILNVNEGILPASTANKSFIPFSLRKGYGLATYQDADASYAYHFYRLLHKAENIYLIYNSEVSKTNGGEPSRFLLQIKQELAREMGDSLNITSGQIATPVIPEEILPIVIKKELSVIEQLRHFLPDKDGLYKRTFSSSAISAYISCSLKFYYRYLAGLKEKENETSTIEDHTFGTILHRVMELLYCSVEGKVDTAVIEKLIKQVDGIVDKAVMEVYNIPVLQLEGSDILLTEVIRELTKRILNADKADTPFEITGLEKKITGYFDVGSYKVALFGSIDRMDEANDVTRIIDYKTGQVDLKSKTIESLLADPEKKALFQLYFYALLFKLNFPARTVKTGFYIARNLGSGISWPNDGEQISEAVLEDFKRHLAAKIAEILNPSIDFIQTADLEQCKYCPYNIICNR